MYSLSRLCEEQANFDTEFAPFLAQFDPTTVITLHGLLTDITRTKTLFPWVVQPLLRRRIGAVCEFLGRLNNSRLRKFRSLYFFQRNDPEEDVRKTIELMQNDSIFIDMYCNEYGRHTHPQVRYLHSSANFGSSLVPHGDYQRIRTLLSFASQDGSTNLPRRHGQLITECRFVVGYQIPDYRELLGVESYVATEYLARIIIHDIGHAWLPELNPRIDSLHNAVMIHAAAAKGTAARSLWEQFVLAECTDPFFFADGYELLRKCEGLVLSHEQQYLLRAYRKWYDSPGHIRNLKHLWDITPGMLPHDARRQAQAMLARMCADGFAQYDLEPLGRLNE